MSLRKILVTGSSGTIGTRLCERLLSDGRFEVAGVDRRPNAWQPDVNAATVIGDLRHPETFARLPHGVDTVVHLAANARVYELVEHPRMALDNMGTIFNVLEYCRLTGVRRVIFASSREVYGNTGQALHNEEDVRVKHCESPYSASKLAGEALVRSYGQCYGIDFVIIRFSNVYGMYDESERVVPLFIRETWANRALTIFGKDKMLDFTYIDDAINGVVLALEKFDQARNEAYNLAYGEGVSILAVAEQIREQLGRDNRIILKEPRTGEVVQYIADIRKARSRLGFDPQVRFVEGVGKSIEWYSPRLPR
jgi:UDP-glucose 4-epimerase